MRLRWMAVVFLLTFALEPGRAISALDGRDTADAHVAAARAAAGDNFQGLFNRVCYPDRPVTSTAKPTDRTTWHADPARVFDNVYFVGQKEYSAWAITTSAGIILIDALYDYSVEDEVVNGLRALGLDPATIKYVVISHGHSDHAAGARLLQDRFGPRVVASEADWQLMAEDTGAWPKPRRDVVATDGQRLTLGETTLTLYLTPGHTPGTISLLIPLKDRGTPHVAAYWGGTAFNWVRGPSRYISPDKPPRFWFSLYRDSVRRFRDVAVKAGADVVMSNHTEFDGATTVKLPALSRRNGAQPNPFVVGPKGVERYLTVGEECATAGLLRLE